MTLKVISGGGKPTGQSRDQIQQKLNVFVGQMRQIENSISVVKRMAETMKWDALDTRLTVCHRNILDTLGFVKRSAKDFLENKGVPRPELAIVVDNEEESENEKEGDDL